MEYKCHHCGEKLSGYDCYEYRGVYACDKHFDIVIDDRDRERAHLIEEEDNKRSRLKGFDLTSDDAIGRANRKIFKKDIEICAKESPRLRAYEGRE